MHVEALMKGFFLQTTDGFYMSSIKIVDEDSKLISKDTEEVCRRNKETIRLTGNTSN